MGPTSRELLPQKEQVVTRRPRNPPPPPPEPPPEPPPGGFPPPPPAPPPPLPGRLGLAIDLASLFRRPACLPGSRCVTPRTSRCGSRACPILLYCIGQPSVCNSALPRRLWRIVPSRGGGFT